MHQQDINHLTLIRMTTGKLPRLPFVDVKNHILGTSYELTVVFPDLTKSVALHKQYKKKSDPVNILSFPLDKNEGEIYITLSAARRECTKFGLTYHEYLIYLMIHGCTHLSGHDHGNVMDALEKKYCKRFNIPYPYRSETL